MNSTGSGVRHKALSGLGLALRHPVACPQIARSSAITKIRASVALRLFLRATYQRAAALTAAKTIGRNNSGARNNDTGASRPKRNSGGRPTVTARKVRNKTLAPVTNAHFFNFLLSCVTKTA